jgi:hypothetical protein
LAAARDGCHRHGNSPRTILEELAAIQSTDVVLPTATLPERELVRFKST